MRTLAHRVGVSNGSRPNNLLKHGLWCLQDIVERLEVHQVDVSVVCRNCHRKLTNQQHDHVSPMVEEPIGKLAVIGHYLLGLCDLLAMLIDTLRDFARSLLNESTYCGESIA